MSQTRSTDPPLDLRSLRFAAWVTTAVLVLVLVTGSAVVLAAQAEPPSQSTVNDTNTERGAAA